MATKGGGNIDIPKKLKLSQAQIDDMKEVFFLFDKDGNGTLDKKELKMVFCALNNNPTDAEMDEIMRQVDRDGNGVLDYEEYVALLQMFLKDPMVEEIALREAFRIFDKERTGKVDRRQLKRLLLANPEVLREKDELGLEEQRIDRLFDKIDVDGNGFIDVEELVAHMCRRTFDDDC